MFSLRSVFISQRLPRSEECIENVVLLIDTPIYLCQFPGTNLLLVLSVALPGNRCGWACPSLFSLGGISSLLETISKGLGIPVRTCSL